MILDYIMIGFLVIVVTIGVVYMIKVVKNDQAQK